MQAQGRSLIVCTSGCRGRFELVMNTL